MYLLLINLYMSMFEKHALEKCTSLNSNNLLYANLTYESGILNRFSRILYLYTFCYTQPVFCLLYNIWWWARDMLIWWEHYSLVSFGLTTFGEGYIWIFLRGVVCFLFLISGKSIKYHHASPLHTSSNSDKAHIKSVHLIQ